MIAWGRIWIIGWWLVVWNIFYFSIFFHILGISSSQVTFIFFQRGRSTTNQDSCYMLLPSGNLVHPGLHLRESDMAAKSFIKYRYLIYLMIEWYNIHIYILLLHIYTYTHIYIYIYIYTYIHTHIYIYRCNYIMLHP